MSGRSIVSAKASRVITAEIGPTVESRRSSYAPLAAKYARDPLRHLEEGHVVILDLVEKKPVVMKPYDHEIEYIREWVDCDHLIETGELKLRNVVVEKTRQMGFTWTTAYLFAWALRWHDARLFAVSLKLDEISDPGYTTDSFFGRIKFLSEYVDPAGTETPLGGFPEHLRPRFEYVGGNSPIVRTAGGGFIAGFASTNSPGRGGGYQGGLIDEFAFVPNGKGVQSSIVFASPTGRVYGSTAHGKNNAFYTIVDERPQGYRFIRQHWSRHPVYSKGMHVAGSKPKTCALCRGNAEKIEWRASNPKAHRYPGKLTSPWYDAAIIGLDDEQVAMELDIDYDASLPARVYPEFQPDLHVLDEPIPYDPLLDLELSWDYGADTTSIAVCQDSPESYRVIGELEMHDTYPEEVADALREYLADELDIPLGYVVERLHEVLSVGDPAGENREPGTGKSIVSKYRELGIPIQSRRHRVASSIRTVKLLLHGVPKPLFVSGHRCPLFIKHISSYRWPTDRQGNRKPGAPKPLHDEHSHMMDSWRYLVAYKFHDGEDDEDDVEQAVIDAVRAAGSGRIDDRIAYGMRG